MTYGDEEFIAWMAVIIEEQEREEDEEEHEEEHDH